MPSKIACCTRFTLALTLSLSLIACGGGGGGGGESTPPPAVPAPAITVQPADVNASVGTSVTFSVTATGSRLSYQWLRNGVDLAGATGAQYVLPVAQFNDSGSKWSVRVSNSAGSAVSAEVKLTVTGTTLLAGSLQANSFINGQLVSIAQDGSGNTYLLDGGLATSLYKVDAQGVVTLLPLSASASDAALYHPTGMTRDMSGNFYVTDGKCMVRKISPAGEITILAGRENTCGHDDGKGSAATFSGISALAVDAANNVFVAEHQTTIRKITPDGMVSTVAGMANVYGSVDGTGSSARFGEMQSMAIDSAGNLYVTDTYGGAAPRIRKITSDAVVTTIAGGLTYGSADGQGSAASFYTLSGLTIDAAGNLYVGDQGNHTIRKITQGGVVTTFAGRSTTANAFETNPIDGPTGTATFRKPVALTMDGSGNVLVAESDPGLQFNALRKISANGTVSTITSTPGSGAADGVGPSAKFTTPRGLALDPSGNVWVADTRNQLIRKIAPDATVTTVAGATALAPLSESGDGKGTSARFGKPTSVAVDSKGVAYVADQAYSTVRKVLSDGTVTTLAGQVMKFNAVDGIGSAANFVGLEGITIDRDGMLYVTDMAAVRRIDPASGTVTTIAGKLGAFAQRGSADGTGATASFSYLSAIAVDSTGNLYVTDINNNNVRKITPNGVVTTLAGSAGITGSMDGQGAAASFNRPTGIAVDKAGNIYVADTGNNLIRQISPVGIVTTVAGQLGANGNVPGSLTNPISQPIGLAFDANGILYVSASNGIFQLHLQ